MKKSVLLFLFCSLISGAQAQFFPFQPVIEIPYFSFLYQHDKVMIQDSSLYECRDGSVQIINVISGKDEYRWKNHYHSNMLLPDKHGNYIILRNNSFIGVYDTILHDYKNINTGPLATDYIRSIGISPNGNIWAVGSQKLGKYNGTSWQTYSHNGFDNIKVIDDTSAYLNGIGFFRFHNGTVDTLFSLPPNTFFRDWDIDSLGNLWIAAKNKLIYAHDTTLVLFDSTNSPVGSEYFNKVVAAKNGHIWTCGEKGTLLEYDGTTWSTHSLPATNIYIDNFNLDSLGCPWVIGGSFNTNVYQYSYMSIYVWNGNSFNAPVSFPFMPYGNIKALAPDGLANDDGIFGFYSSGLSFRVNRFSGSPDQPQANDVNCFRAYTRYASPGILAYGTHNGVYNLNGQEPGLDSSVLPSDTVNYIFDNHGSEYVCTDRGLLIYNGVFFNTLDTSNSPLPSNKITFAIVAESQPYNKLYVGTDNGIAIYSNNQWTVFDSSDFGLSSCYVTGILPPVYWDTAIYVTTMGSGLIKLSDSGFFEILNTSNGNFQDDSLYYVIPAELGDCGSFILIGTNKIGLAAFDLWTGSFEYYNTSNGYPFSQSRAAVDNTYFGGNILMGTDAGLYWASPCGGINESSVTNNINVYPNPCSGIFTIAQLSGSQIEIYNLVGELIYKTVSTGNTTTIDFTSKAKGIYFIKTIDRNQKVLNKKLILH